MFFFDVVSLHQVLQGFYRFRTGTGHIPIENPLQTSGDHVPPPFMPKPLNIEAKQLILLFFVVEQIGAKQSGSTAFITGPGRYGEVGRA